MMDIILLVIMSWVAIRASHRLNKQKPLFAEFGASNSIVYLAWLYPIGPIVLLALAMKFGFWVGAAFALVCYLWPVYVVRSLRKVFDRSGTDRTKSVQDELALLFFVGVSGAIYVVASTTIGLLLAVSAPVG